MTTKNAIEVSEQVTVTLSNGVTYKVLPVSETLLGMAKDGVRKKFIEAGEPISPPTYEISLAGGGKEFVPHDETTLQTNEDRAAWKKHKEALTRLEQAQNEMQVKVWLTGLDAKLPEDNEWLTMQEWLGVEIPKGNAMDLRHHYLITEVMKTPDDFLRVVEAVTKATYAGVVSAEDLAAAVGSFRSALQRNPAIQPIAEERKLDA